MPVTLVVVAKMSTKAKPLLHRYLSSNMRRRARRRWGFNVCGRTPTPYKFTTNLEKVCKNQEKFLKN